MQEEGQGGSKSDGAERTSLRPTLKECKKDLMMNRMSGMLTETKDDLPCYGRDHGVEDACSLPVIG